MRALGRIGWFRVLVVLGLALLLSRATDRRVVTGLESAVLMVALTLASFWGLFHPRRVLPQLSTALRDALLASLVTFLLFRGGLDIAHSDGLAESLLQPLIVPLLAPMASGVACVLLFPVYLWFNLTLVALLGMSQPRDAAAERSVLPLFWPILAGSVALDFLLWKVTLWPPAAATLASPFLTLFLVHALRRRDRDAQQLFWNLTMLLQRKCTRRHGVGPRDFRGVVLGVLAGGLTLCLATPLLHVFVAPYQGASYAAATQLGSRVQGLRSFLLTEGTLSGNFLPTLIPLPARKLEAFQRVVVVTYDEAARRLAQEKSEARLQTELLQVLAKTRPAAIALALPPEDSENQPALSATTPRIGQELLKRNTRDFPLLAAQIAAMQGVFVAAPPHSTASDEGERVLKAAQGVGRAQIESPDTVEAPALNLVASPPPISCLMTVEPRQKAHYLLDYRLDLGQVRTPLAVSQLLQRQKLYDATTGSWKTPEQFFQNKLVFIEALTPHLHQTPAGVRGELEIQAQAAASLLSGGSFGTLPFGIMAVLVLALTAGVGQLCVGKAPLESLWRVALPIALVSGGCFLLTAFGSVWADPVLPLTGGVLAFLMVTQFTFAVERDERTRNRSLLARFIPPQAVEELLDDPEGKLGLGGKRRRIVVLFADVRGFSGFAEKSTPEEVVTTMNRYLMAMTDALNAHEGILDKYTGDGLMALFLVGDKQPDSDVLRAVRAAEAMAQAVHDVAKTMAAEGNETLAVGLGLHYGEAVVGLVGHPTRQVNYTALGHTVVVAARLQTLALGGDIILSDAVYRALPPSSVSAEAGETVTVKGVADPVPIYRIRTTR